MGSMLVVAKARWLLLGKLELAGVARLGLATLSVRELCLNLARRLQVPDMVATKQAYGIALLKRQKLQL